MAKYIQRPPAVEAITFDEFVQYGINQGAGLLNGQPLHFEYNGCPVTHEDYNTYIISNSFSNAKMTRDHMLVTYLDGSVWPALTDEFLNKYQLAFDFTNDPFSHHPKHSSRMI